MSKRHHSDSVDRDAQVSDAYNAGYNAGLEIGGNEYAPDELDADLAEHWASGFADGRAQ